MSKKNTIGLQVLRIQLQNFSKCSETGLINEDLSIKNPKLIRNCS